LGQIGPDAKPAVPALRAELASKDPVVRIASAYALVHIDLDDATVKETLPVLIEGLDNSLPAVRRGAAEGLGRIGKAARSAEAKLREVARDNDPTVRKAALTALESMGAVVDAPTSISKEAK
jgi:HEAT repeat protein